MKDAVKTANLKMYHVMSVKQTLREDLAEHAYQFRLVTGGFLLSTDAF